MPIYLLQCLHCQQETEKWFSSSNNFSDWQVCPACKHYGQHRKLVSGIHLGRGVTSEENKAREMHKKENDWRAEMKAEAGVHEITPVLGNTIEDAYKDVMAQKSKIKENFAAQSEDNARKAKIKHREFAARSRIDADKKGRQIMEQRKKEEHQKRTIRL